MTLRQALGVILVAALVGLLSWVSWTRGISAERLLSLAVSGAMLGGILALGAIGITLVYGILRFGNFAHGDLMTVGAYVAFAVMALLPQGPAMAPFSFGWEFLIALLIAMPITGFVSLAADWLIYSRLRRRRSSAVIVAMASLGVAFFVRSLIYLGWGSDFKFYYQGRIPSALQLPWGVQVRPDQLFTFGFALILVILIYLLLEKTKIGKAMRATADNPALARVSGIAIGRVIFWTWMIGGALAGASGVMLGLNSQLRPEMGWLVLLSLFAAVILGGIGNPYGALVGALIIGMIREISTAFLNPTYGPGVAFLVMIIILLVRPQGIFSKVGE